MLGIPEVQDRRASQRGSRNEGDRDKERRLAVALRGRKFLSD